MLHHTQLSISPSPPWFLFSVLKFEIKACACQAGFEPSCQPFFGWLFLFLFIYF
jgi:hypothetical protein